MSADDIELSIEMGKESMDHAIEHLHKELLKIRTGKASPSMLSGIFVDYYGSPTPLNQVANVGASDSKTLTIQPWEKKLLAPIEQAIFAANLGLTPMNDGEFVRITIPALTEERRVQLVKQSKHLGEESKIGLRSARHKIMDAIKQSVRNGYSEDLGKRKESLVEKITHEYGDKVDEMAAAKEKDIMTI